MVTTRKRSGARREEGREAGGTVGERIRGHDEFDAMEL